MDLLNLFTTGRKVMWFWQPRRFGSVALIVLGILPCLTGAPQEAGPTKLKLVIIEGDGAINNVRERTAREPIVQVVDENDRPVAGATVFFMLPNTGASANFADGTFSLRTTTDKLGRAVARGLRANGEVGKYQIRVEASFQNVTVNGTLGQANAVLTSGAAAGGAAGVAAGISTKAVVVLAIVGAAAAGGTVALIKGGDDPAKPPQPPPVAVIRPGNPSFGAP
jgi:hypothetical protein